MSKCFCIEVPMIQVSKLVREEAPNTLANEPNSRRKGSNFWTTVKVCQRKPRSNSKLVLELSNQVRWQTQNDEGSHLRGHARFTFDELFLTQFPTCLVQSKEMQMSKPTIRHWFLLGFCPAKQVRIEPRVASIIVAVFQVGSNSGSSIHSFRNWIKFLDPKTFLGDL